MMPSSKLADSIARLAAHITGLPAGRTGKWLVLAMWVAIIVVAFPLASRLSGVVEDNSTAELPRAAESTRVAELVDRFPDANVTTGVVVYVRESGLTADDRAKVDADRLAFKRFAVQPIPPTQPSDDGQALLLAVPFDSSTVTEDASQVRTSAGENLPAGLEAKLTGPAGIGLDVSEALSGIDTTALLVAAAVVAALLLIIYRSPVLWVLPLLNAFLALQLANAAIYLLAKHAGLAVSSGSASILAVLVFGVSTDYALLLLARYREELRREPDRHVAMAVALRRAGPAIAASAATTALGLLCLLAADMGFNYTLGPAAAISILAGLATMITLLPALLVISGRWVFWPVVPRHGGARTASRSVWGRIGDGVARRPRRVWVGAVLALGVLAFGVVGLETGLDEENIVTTTPDSLAGERLLAAHYPAGQSRPVQVIADAPAAADVTSALRDVDGVAEISQETLSTDGELIMVYAVLADPSDSPAAEATVDRIRTATRAVPGADAMVGGSTASTMDQDQAQEHDRQVVIPLVLVVVFTVLLLLLRALVAPLLLIATVVLSYFAALGASWLLFTHVFDFPAVDSQLMLIGFLFLVTLGVDYNIFLISRVREEVKRHDRRDAHREGIVRGLAVTGAVISSAGLVLAATFSVLAFLPLVLLVQLGVLVSLGVLLDTFLVRSILVPALAMDVGRWFWWPSRLARPAPAEEPVERPYAKMER